MLDVLNKLVERGNTVIVIEHNMDVIKMADYIIDLGKEGGREGGNMVFAGHSRETDHNAGTAIPDYSLNLSLSHKNLVIFEILKPVTDGQTR